MPAGGQTPVGGDAAPEEATATPTEPAIPTETPVPCETATPTAVPVDLDTDTFEPTPTVAPLEPESTCDAPNDDAPTATATATGAPEGIDTAVPVVPLGPDPSPTPAIIQPADGTTAVGEDAEVTEGTNLEPTSTPAEVVPIEPDGGLPTPSQAPESGGDVDTPVIEGTDPADSTIEPAAPADETPPADVPTPEDEAPTPTEAPSGFDVAAAETVMLFDTAPVPDGALQLPASADAVAAYSGGAVTVADFAVGVTYDLGASRGAPVWSPRSQLLLLSTYATGDPYPTIATWDRATGALVPLPTATGDEVHSDLPVGWVGSTLYYQRTYPDEPGRVELRSAAFDGSGDSVVWSAEEAGPGSFDADVSQALINAQGNLIAYVTGGSLVVASVDDPGSPIAFLGSPGVAFDWSPEGNALLVNDGTRLAVIDAYSGTQLAISDNSAGTAIGGALWLPDGLSFVEFGGTPALRRLAVGA